MIYEVTACRERCLYKLDATLVSVMWNLTYPGVSEGRQREHPGASVDELLHVLTGATRVYGQTCSAQITPSHVIYLVRLGRDEAHLRDLQCRP